MDRMTVAGVLSQVQVDYGIGDGQAGALQTAFVVSYMVFAPIFGYLGDRKSRKLIMAIGVFTWTVFTIIGSFMPVSLILVLFLYGFICSAGHVSWRLLCARSLGH